MRLDRYLSRATELSRSQAQRAVRRGAVAVDGAIVKDPSQAVSECASVRLWGTRLCLPGHRYLMLHKPAGYVCARRDARHPDVFELVGEPRVEELHVAGRLDVEVTGLVLLTDDGAWSHALTAPRRKQPKTYVAELAEPLAPVAADSLRTGVLLHGEARLTQPATVEMLAPRRVRLTLREGRYHQVKRMLAAVGNRVLALHRERIGPYRLDSLLAPGEYRHLTAAEVAALAKADASTAAQPSERHPNPCL